MKVTYQISKIKSRVNEDIKFMSTSLVVPHGFILKAESYFLVKKAQ